MKSISSLFVIALAIAFVVWSSVFAADAAQPGCALNPPWLCYLNETWWQGSATEAAARARLLKICHETPSAVVCNDNGQIVSIPKHPAC